MSRTQGLWACALVAAAVVACGCKSSGYKHYGEQAGAFGQRADEVIDDPARADQVQKLSASLRSSIDQLAALNDRYITAAVAANADHDTDAKAFSAELETIDSERLELVDRVLATRAQLVALTTESEWLKLGGKP